MYKDSKKKTMAGVITYKNFRKHVSNAINRSTHFALDVVLDYIGKQRDRGRSDTEILRGLELLIQKVKEKKSVFNLKVSKKFDKIKGRYKWR